MNKTIEYIEGIDKLFIRHAQNSNDTENIITPHIKSKPHAMECAIEIKCNVTIVLGITLRIQ